MSDPSSHRLRDLPLAARCRLAFMEGVIEAWCEANGSAPSPDLLVRMLARCPGGPAEVAAQAAASRDRHDKHRA
jgi:hypothetical protein